MGKYFYSPLFKIRFIAPIFAIVSMAAFTGACNFPIPQAVEEDIDPSQEQHLSDPNARMYQMYYDSSADPEQNQLQVRRFIGHLRMTDFEGIFGDVKLLPQDANCNFTGGAVLEHGLIWYLTLTPDLVGANLVSIAPDGTVSSAFDLDGDRVVDILDIRLADNRRYSIITEETGLDPFELWMQGQDPFCNTELIQLLDLPSLGCDETGDGSSSGAAAGNGLRGYIDPIDQMCSQYDTGPSFNNVWTKTRGLGRQVIYEDEYGFEGDSMRVVRTESRYDGRRGGYWITKTIMYYDMSDPDNPEPYQITVEQVTPFGSPTGTRTTRVKDPATGVYSEPEEEYFEIQESDQGRPDYDEDATTPIPENPFEGQTEENPGPEGDDSNVAAFCRARGNYRSGVEQATEQDPSAMSVSCNDVVGDPDMPDDPNCMIMEWAGPDDFAGIVEPADDGCDPFQDPDGAGFCEPATVAERFRGLAAELGSINVPEIDFCPEVLCDPAQAAEMPKFTSGETDNSCIEILECREQQLGQVSWVYCKGLDDPDFPELTPLDETCPPGTYYAPVTNRCIDIQVPQSGGNEGGSGGTCNESAASCSGQGYSFDENKCECVPIQ